MKLVKGGIKLMHCFVLLCCTLQLKAQINMVEFGKNKIQYQKFKWEFYQSTNCNVHFYKNGLELAKFVAQTTEEELPLIEKYVEFSIQRRINIVLYNHYDDYKQTNIGLNVGLPNTGGGVTKLVNNKMVLYFNGDHNQLRLQIREGIARIMVESLLFGDDIGEIAQNQVLLDIPKWMTDGYISYVAENWNTALDNELKSVILAERYKNFNHFAFKQPQLAGHAFWYFIEEKYTRENVTYLLYLSRIYKNVNKAIQVVCKKKFKVLLREFMEHNEEKYYKDIRSRKNIPSGKLTILKEIEKKDYFRFQPNPNPKNNTYVLVQFYDGVTKVIYQESFLKQRVIWKSGIKNLEASVHPQYPLLAWEPKGTEIALVVWEKGKLLLHVYDALQQTKIIENQVLPFDQVNNLQYMLDDNTLIISGVKGGQSDIFIYQLTEQKTTQITNDVYDDRDASFVAFAEKTGIIFSSNRPSPEASTGDTVLPKSKYNIFLIDNWNRPEFRQITQLSKLPFGDARSPAQYNLNHFTFISDENGIANRRAGLFKTNLVSIDSAYWIGEDVLKNPDKKELDSVLKHWNKPKPDSVFAYVITADSAYTFPVSNYQSSILETGIAGVNGQLFEVNRQGDFKFIYKLKVDENILKKRNVNARPTEYAKRMMRLQKVAESKNLKERTDLTDSLKGADALPYFFESEFEGDTSNTSLIFEDTIKGSGIFARMKKYPYTPKYFVDNLTTSFLSNNALLINRFQPYSGATGPVQLGNNNALNAMTRLGAMEFMEDQKFTGGFRINYGLQDKEVFMRYDNLRRRLDWGATYYRSTLSTALSNGAEFFNTRLISNIYQGNITYPFNEVERLRFIAGIRNDRYVIRTDDRVSNPLLTLSSPDLSERFLMLRGEFVHDNTVSLASNTWQGLRYKTWFEFYDRMGGNYQGGKNGRSSEGKMTFNWGFDARHYYPLYRNIIWAVRAAGDFSWGNNKFIYYLGGTDGWLMLGNNQVERDGQLKERYFNTANKPAPDQTYVYESLAVNLRGFTQNAANGNNAMVINSEIRVPVFTTLFDRPINNAFLRNFQLVQFVDLGTAWNGKFSSWERPQQVYQSPDNPLTVVLNAPGTGPFLGSYGFGARSTFLGYFLRVDAGWQMNGIFKNKPIVHFSLGYDF